MHIRPLLLLVFTVLSAGAAGPCGVETTPQCRSEGTCLPREERREGESEDGEGEEGEGELGEGDGEEGEGEAGECRAPRDCPNIPCECVEGPPVNTQHCTNQRCEEDWEACPTACENFGTRWVHSPPVDEDEDENEEEGRCDASLFLANSCGTCAFEDCCTVGTACFSDAGCTALNGCVINCVRCQNGCGSESFCEDSCKALSTIGAAQLFDPRASCMDANCPSNCVP